MPDITLMYKTGEELITYATTSTNTLAEGVTPIEERCFPDVAITATGDSCQFWRGFHGMNCTANFTKDGGSEKYNAMNASCRYYFLDEAYEPMRTHEHILAQAVIGYTGSNGWVPHGYCAVFNVTYLGGYIRFAGDWNLPENGWLEPT
ncbi:uncharacterized protein LOC142588789 [Dermacentor variabilis]|uniref:uncharacterized protein LOC142588789 n=1 Tax=Dermacentor variabilis TaxID=34621 RepID=UPI003F5B4C27